MFIASIVMIFQKTSATALPPILSILSPIILVATPKSSSISSSSASSSSLSSSFSWSGGETPVSTWEEGSALLKNWPKQLLCPSHQVG